MIPETVKRLGYEIRQYKRGLPTVASFDITERCGLHCKMCRFWVDGNHDAASELSTAEIRGLIDGLVDDLGVRRIRLLGGEPFLRPDCLEIVRHAKSRGAHVNVVSEGSHVDEARAEEIVRSGLDSIRFSVDGVGSRHDLVRGKRGAYLEVTGAIRRVQEARRRLRSRTPEVQVFAVISSLNYDQLLPLHEACAGELAPARLLFGPVWEATVEEVRASVWKGRPLADRHHLPIGDSLQLGPEEARVFAEQVQAIAGRNETSTMTRLLARLVRPVLRREFCPETNSFHVDPFGRVKFCSVYMNYAFGKFPESSVKEIWYSRNHRDFHRDLATHGFLPLCRTVCGSVDRYYVGTPRQLLRNVLLRLVPSPLRATTGRTQEFRTAPPDVVLDREPLAHGTHPWVKRGRRAAPPSSGEPTGTGPAPTASTGTPTASALDSH